MATSPPPAQPKQAKTGLRIVAKRESYYSAGILPAFTAEPREIPSAQLSDAQIAELRADPWLIVQECEIKPAAASASTSATS